MQSLYSAFPNGWPGIGLLVLRLLLALSEVGEGLCAITSPGGGLWTSLCYCFFAGLVGVAISAGLLTPIAAAAGTLGYLCYATWLIHVIAPHHLREVLPALDLSGISLAVLLLGPGAFSIDARVFGRREIIIPENEGPRHP